MSFRPDKKLALAGLQTDNLSTEDYSALFKKVFEEGMHGLCFSIYEEGQEPGDVISIDQVRRRLKILQPHTKWIRSFSCIEGNEHVPKVSKELGMQTLVGAWLGDDKDLNEKEIEALISLAKEGFVDIAAVGNEVMYRGDLTEEELLEYIYRVKEAIPDIPVGYVDAYYEFNQRPKITEACDVILTNCYPFWEGCHVDYSLLYMKQMFHAAKAAAAGKRVIITETGWPSQGASLQASEPGFENAIKYFVNSQLWSLEDNIEMFYFSSFDESWKVSKEGDVGAYWGIWDMHGQHKFF